ncbi:MAG: AAA family ATPase [Deltaproteobacteria bacterium]|nr:AAA family ATPase [Deltaproteobacteria bacterium]
MLNEITQSEGSIPAEITDPVERLRQLCAALLKGLVERDLSIRLALLATLAGEHLLLIGPPGTAKSLVARRLRFAFHGATYFERLLTRFTVPEEIFGPLSIKGLEEDRYERITRSFLPTASIAFLDEIFKANSAILNALLTILNEREFDNGASRVRTPLLAVVGASNELPQGEELDALYDRFLLRLHIDPVSKSGFRALIGLRGESAPKVPATWKLTEQELRSVQEAAQGIEVPADVVTLLCELRDWCVAEKLRVSDRRWRKVVKLLQVSAATNGRTRVSVWDCWLLQHCLWDAPEQRKKVYDWYASRVGTSTALDPARLTQFVVAWEAKLKSDQESRSQRRNAKGQALYKGTDGKPTIETRGRVPMIREGTNDSLYLAPANAQVRHNHYYWLNLEDRTNGGNGFTLKELDALGVGEQPFPNWRDRTAYLAEPTSRLTRDTDLTPLLEPTRQKQAYIDACLCEVDAILDNVVQYQAGLQAHVESMERDIRSHLWVTADFVEPAAQTLQRTMTEVETLLHRATEVRKGFELLPRENPDPALATAPAVAR